jgi:hypothetical protein
MASNNVNHTHQVRELRSGQGCTDRERQERLLLDRRQLKVISLSIRGGCAMLLRRF